MIRNIKNAAKFIPTLARELLLREQSAPERSQDRYLGGYLGGYLQNTIIFMPTARSALALEREIFIQNSLLHAKADMPVIVPTIIPLGNLAEHIPKLAMRLGFDLDEILPLKLCSFHQRLGYLSAIYDMLVADASDNMPGRSFRIALEIQRVLDDLNDSGVAISSLKTLVPDNFAKQWAFAIKTLLDVSNKWYSLQQNLGILDPLVYRNKLIEYFIRQFEKHQPDISIIAAGSTGSIKSTANLLRMINSQPKGEVILAGFNDALSREMLSALHPTDPQYAFKHLLEHLNDTTVAELASHGPTRHQVSGFAPETLTNETLSSRLSKIEIVEARNINEEARIICLMILDCIEARQPISIVTGDKELAELLHQQMLGYRVFIDSSHGTPLKKTRAGSLCLGVIEYLNDIDNQTKLVALLEHPDLTIEGDNDSHNRYKWQVNLALRKAGFGATIADVMAADESTKNIWHHFMQAILPMYNLRKGKHRLDVFITAHSQVLESLMQQRGEVSYATLGSFLEALKQAAQTFSIMDFREYKTLLSNLIGREVVRYSIAEEIADEQNIRIVHLYSPLESRLMTFTNVIIAGMNEGSFPALNDNEIWLSEGMRQKLGVSNNALIIGKSAHDFHSLLGADKIFITRSAKKGGSIQQKSRFLEQIELAFEQEGLSIPQGNWLCRVHESEQPPAVQPTTADVKIIRAMASPPLKFRPQKLSVTQVEKLIRDPYGLYAQKVMRLKDLDPLDAEPDLNDFGNIVHNAMDIYAKTFAPGTLETLMKRMYEIGDHLLKKSEINHTKLAFWWPRFKSVSTFLVMSDLERRRLGASVCSEISGEIEMQTPKGNSLIITAKADRVELLADGSATIIDFKTGKVPTQHEVNLGIACQLPLEALIMERGGFAAINAAQVTALEYWKVGTNKHNSKINHASRNSVPDLVDMCRDIIIKLIDYYADETNPYIAQPNPKYAPDYNVYSHLERM